MADDAEDLAPAEFTKEELTLLGELEKKHKRITPFRIEGFGLIVLKPPTRKRWGQFQKDAGNELHDAQLTEQALVQDCVAHPDATVIPRILDEYPVALTELSQAVAKLGGGNNKDLVRNLGKDWKRPAATT
jgi:hypothetical protein